MYAWVAGWERGCIFISSAVLRDAAAATSARCRLRFLIQKYAIPAMIASTRMGVTAAAAYIPPLFILPR